MQSARGADRARGHRVLDAVEQLTVRLGVVPRHGDGDLASRKCGRRTSRSGIALAEHEVHDLGLPRMQLLGELAGTEPGCCLPERDAGAGVSLLDDVGLR